MDSTASPECFKAETKRNVEIVRPVLLSFPDMPASALLPIRNVVSTSSLYPFKGIWYFCVHPEFYPLFGRRLIPLTFVSIIVLGLLFAFTYLPQVAFLAIWQGPGAWFNAVFLVLGEGQLLIALLFEALMVDETMVDVFDVRSFPPAPVVEAHRDPM